MTIFELYENNLTEDNINKAIEFIKSIPNSSEMCGRFIGEDEDKEKAVETYLKAFDQFCESLRIRSDIWDYGAWYVIRYIVTNVIESSFKQEVEIPGWVRVIVMV